MNRTIHLPSRKYARLSLHFLGLAAFFAGPTAFADDPQAIGVIFKTHLPVLMVDIDKGKSHQRLEVMTSKDTAVTLDGKPATLDDIAQGMPCRVTYHGANNIATKVEVLTPSRKGS